MKFGKMSGTCPHARAIDDAFENHLFNEEYIEKLDKTNNIEWLKEEYIEKLGKRPSGSKANNIEWLKKKIYESKKNNVSPHIYKGYHGNIHYSGKEIYFNIGKALNQHWQKIRKLTYRIVGDEIFIPLYFNEQCPIQPEGMLLENQNYVQKWQTPLNDQFGLYKKIIKGENLVELEKIEEKEDKEEKENLDISNSDLNEYTVKELKQICKAKNIKKYSKLKKNELIKILNKQ